MEIFGYTIIDSKKLFQLKWDKGMLETAIKLRPTQDDLIKFGNDMVEGQREIWQKEVKFYQDLLQKRNHEVAALKDKIKELSPS